MHRIVEINDDTGREWDDILVRIEEIEVIVAASSINSGDRCISPIGGQSDGR